MAIHDSVLLSVWIIRRNMKISRTTKIPQLIVDGKFCLSGLSIIALQPDGKGEQELLDSADSEHAHKINRRVGVRVQKTLMLPVY